MTDADLDDPVGGRELDRIGQQIPDDLLQAARISRYQRWLRIELRLDLNSFRLGRGPDDVNSRLDNRRQFDGLQIEMQVTGDDSGDIKDVID